MSAEPLGWQRAIAEALVAAGVDVVAYVPDARLRGVISALEGGPKVRTLTREEECVGYACGFSAAGGRPAVLMQCSGLGNALNALGSFAIPYAIGIPLVLSMRGTLGEENPVTGADGPGDDRPARGARNPVVPGDEPRPGRADDGRRPRLARTRPGRRAP